MKIVYNDWIINYHKDWKGYKAQVWREEFGPVLTTGHLPSSNIWLVPGTGED